MRLIRPLILGALIAGGFYWYTTHHSAVDPTQFISRPTKVELTEAAAPPAFDSEEQTTIEVYKKGIQSVVNITSTAVAFDFFYGPVPQEGQGSGFIIDKEGHILTNYHVIANAREVEVTLHNKKKYKATVIGRDRSHDLAVIQIQAPALLPATLGDSKGLIVGQNVYAIGNPFGLSGTMTRGIISSLRPIRTPEGSEIDEAIQTDAAINPGNSGGPLLNAHAEVIGINAMIATGGSNQSAGIGFAIPINTAKAVINDLITIGRVRRPSLGIRTLPIGPELAQELGLPADYGVLIVEATRGGSADRAGLRGGNQRAYLGNVPVMVGGDLIIAIDGEQIADQQDLAAALNRHKAGDTVTITIFRAKRKMDVKVVLGEMREQT
ncbi:MAG TPA: trypsin-like peptidase domain-containing protein [Candidatus Angelobacter sp.]|jgi:S1-C subfamily serine protease|nr:trypsin-like peptidase domain-containing protein [Candidatus Angelobacter sp.]